MVRTHYTILLHGAFRLSSEPHWREREDSRLICAFGAYPGEPPNSIIANEFYANILEQKAWWASELESEGMMTLDLPHHDETDGDILSDMATHGG